MHQIEIENYELLPSGLLVVAQDNEKEATTCCYNNHCNIDGQSPHQGKLGCTSATMTSKVGKNESYVCVCKAHIRM